MCSPSQGGRGGIGISDHGGSDEGLQGRLGTGWEKEIGEFLPCPSVIINAWKRRGHWVNC